MPRPIVCILAAAALSLCTADIAVAAPCSALKTPPAAVNIDVRTAEPIIRRDLSSALLTRQLGSASQAFGRTETSTSYRVRMAGAYSPGPASSGGCYAVRQVEVTIALEAPQVFLASELSPYGCGYRVTLEHEMRHVAVTRDVLVRHAGGLEKRLMEALSGGAFAVASEADGTAQAADTVKAVVAKTMEAIRLDAESGNAALDSPTAYRREAAKCPSWP